MKVTIIIPVFNQEVYLTSAIESALRQTYKDCSVLVIDDGSTDSTPSILDGFGDRIRVIRQENAGTSAAWNTALEAIDDDIVVGLDSDDEFVPSTVEQALLKLSGNSDADVIYSDYEFIDGSGNATKTVRNPDPGDPTAQLARLHDRLGERDNFLPFGHVRLYRRQTLLDIGGYDPQYLYAEDYDLTLRLAEHGASFVRVPQVLYRYRWHESNKGVVTRDGQVQDVRRSFSQFLERNPHFQR